MKTRDEAMALAEQALNVGDWPRALLIYDTMTRNHIDDLEAMIGAAIAHSRLGNLGTAISLFTYATELRPDIHATWGNLGMSLRMAGHTDMAKVALKKSLEISDNSAECHACLSGCYVNEGNPEPGIFHAKKAMAIDPNERNAKNNAALCYMELGRWDEAWPLWRYRINPEQRPRDYPGTRWEGQPIDNLIVHGEQGLGDEIMFLGCLRALMPRICKRLVIECAPRLMPLVKEGFPDAVVIGRNADFETDMLLPGSVAYAAMGDLAEFLGTPPKRSGYFVAEPNPSFANTVLIAFKGGTMRSHEALRNPPRETWAPVIDAIRAKGLRPVSIQYGANGADMAAEMGIEHDQLAADDLVLQAEAIAGARALVTVQQAALHLGGALGADVLGVVSNKPAWRYGLRGAMPWYQTVALFRQKPKEDWAEAMKRVARGVSALEDRVAA